MNVIIWIVSTHWICSYLIGIVLNHSTNSELFLKTFFCKRYQTFRLENLKMSRSSSIRYKLSIVVLGNWSNLNFMSETHSTISPERRHNLLAIMCHEYHEEPGSDLCLYHQWYEVRHCLGFSSCCRYVIATGSKKNWI